MRCQQHVARHVLQELEALVEVADDRRIFLAADEPELLRYRAFFSLAELLPAIGGAQAWLLFDVNGKALEGKEAPLRLVVPSDKTHDRNIYGITSLTLVDGASSRAAFPEHRTHVRHRAE